MTYVFFSGIGTLGDALPLMRLALALQSRGATCAIACDRAYRSVAEGHGLRWVHGGEASAVPELWRRLGSERSLLRRSARYHDEILAPDFAGCSGAVLDECEAADAVVTSFFAPPAERALSQWKPTTIIYVDGDPSAEPPAARVPQAPWFQRVWALDPAVWPGAVAPAENVVGFLYGDEEPIGTDPIPLDFAPGLPLVVVNFGSLAAMVNPELLDAVAAAQARHPFAVVHQVDGMVAPVLRGELWLEVGRCPHSLLLQRASLFVHHGGSGTTGAALAAGVPSLVVPQLYHQMFVGRALARAGLGHGAAGSFDELDRPLAAAIVDALRDDETRSRARAFAGSGLRRNGTSAAAALVASACGLQEASA